MTDAPTPPELGRAIERIELDTREIKQDLKEQSKNYVTRGEFEAWRTGLDREVVGIKDSLKDGLTEIKKSIGEIKSARPSWLQVTPIIISAILAALVIFPGITK